MSPGREAATVRQLCLVLVLVAASFLGGAFVNGPGLRWVQTQLLGSLGWSEGGEIAAVDLKTAAGPSSPEAWRGPVAPVPTVISDGATGTADAPERRPARPPGSGGTGPPASPGSSPRSSPPLTGPLASASAGAATGSDRGRTPSRAGSPAAAPARAAAPLDPSVVPAVQTTPPAAPGLPAPHDPGTPPALPDSLASLMPPGDPSLSLSPSPSPPPPPPPAADSAPPRSSPPPQGEPRREPARAGDEADWVALGRAMQTLGISRFTLEGQPGGRVVFSCLIPVAGRQAVAQRFEAEGDDGFRAARAALRRVALWRATQSSGESP
jgi:hypothetical protein